MGGKALKSIETRRLHRADFERVSKAVVAGLVDALPGVQVDVIAAYRAKDEFGDLDVLVVSEGVQDSGGGDLLKRLAVECFYATELFKNGNVLSFDYRAAPGQTEPGFQVDVITMPAASYDFALKYFAYNDLGNLIGRTAHKQGMSFGHDGLWLPIREGDYLFRSILVTRDFDAALRYLGYDPTHYAQGFDTLEDIFEYVAGSAYFNRSIFLLENRNHRSRVRDRKRKTYTEFLTWCEARPDLPAFEYPEDKKTWIPHLAAAFPGFAAEYDKALHDLATQRAVKSRFNGEYVSSLTGLQGKELGMLMKHFKESFDSQEALQHFVLTNPESLLQERVQAIRTRLALYPSA